MFYWKNFLFVREEQASVVGIISAVPTGGQLYVSLKLFNRLNVKLVQKCQIYQICVANENLEYFSQSVYQVINVP